MTLSDFLLLYGAGVYLVAGYILTDPLLASRLCARCKTPGRETLVALVAGVLWPLLAVAFLAGLVWHSFLRQDEYGRGHW